MECTTMHFSSTIIIDFEKLRFIVVVNRSLNNIFSIKSYATHSTKICMHPALLQIVNFIAIFTIICRPNLICFKDYSAIFRKYRTIQNFIGWRFHCILKSASSSQIHSSNKCVFFGIENGQMCLATYSIWDNE